MAAEGLAYGQNFRLLESLRLAAAPDKAVGPRRLGRDRQQVGAILDQPRDRLMRAIPLQHGEFGMVQRRALAVAEHMSEGENPLLARREQLFAGEFRRGMQVKPAFVAPLPDQLHAEGRNMRLIAARHLQRGRLHLDKSLMGEKLPNRRPEQGANLQKGLAVGVNILGPPGRNARHYWAIRDFSGRGFAARGEVWF